MDIVKNRRERLREWFKSRTLPEKEKSYISQLIGGRASFGEKAARRIERDYGMNTGYLDSVLQYNKELQDYSRNIGETIPLRGRVPLISLVAAGNWSESVDNYQPGEAEEWIATTIQVRQHTYALRVQGDSMEPKFPSGAIIVVEPEEEARNGSFVIVRQNGSEATFKQLVIDGGQRYLKPLNDRYPIMQMLPDAVICGVVKQMVMNV